VTRADCLYLFCTCTRAFCRFSPIEPIAFSKSFENSTMATDRLLPPPPYKSSCFNQIQTPILALYLIRVFHLSSSDEDSRIHTRISNRLLRLVLFRRLHESADTDAGNGTLLDTHNCVNLTHRLKMRTNIDIDDRLMRQAMRSSSARTKRAVVEEALRLLIQTRGQSSLRRLRGQVAWNGDLDTSRLERRAK
jgi:Arc/MetJ family transcription regulator